MHLTPEITFVPVPDARKSGEIIVGPNDTAPTVGADGQEQVASPAGNAFTPEIASPKVELDEAALLLLKLAELIEKRGHCKHVLFVGDRCTGPVCIWGGFSAIASEIGDATAPPGRWTHRAAERLRAHLGCDEIQWNNAPERTAEEVIEVLRRVALEGK